MAKAQRLIIFTRYPEPGQVKTRLIPALGEEGAAGLARRLAQDTLAWGMSLARQEPVRLEVRFAGGDETAMRSWLGLAPLYRPQGEGDLGQRMARALHQALQEGEERVVLVGIDCPRRDDRLMSQAFQALASHDLVLGPAQDGGYYLVGLRQPAPAIFQGISWGGPEVLRQTLDAAGRAGLSTHLLATLPDIDRPEDLPSLKEAPQPPRLEPDPGLISVVMPALNEAAGLPATLAPLLGLPGVEMLVVDGGSGDGTFETAQALGAEALLSFRGRARQMNLGAALARGGLLLFLHADTRLPAGWRAEARRVLAQPGVALGCFRFALDQGGTGAALVERMVDYRTRRLGLPYGDQGLFLTAERFTQAGGYAEMPIMEDYELVRRLSRQGRVVQAGLKASTSGRRWRQLGLIRTTLVNQLIVLGFHLGVPPATLRRWYQGGTKPLP
ncbi:MAG: TIGR04283 family arsenosugar biosynthesis glycosyltransferase [Desulfarculus sp.]|nr:TIGR04283 family arsenosugar biosynthesis glycosyltransferase [Desulfarculus sp.]